MQDNTVNTNPASDAGLAAATGGAGNPGTTPNSIIGDSRSALQPGDPGYEPPRPIAGDTSGDNAPANNNAPTERQPSVTDDEVHHLNEATIAPGEHGATHVLVANDHVSVLRRALQDVTLGVEGAWERFETAFHRIF